MARTPRVHGAAARPSAGRAALRTATALAVLLSALIPLSSAVAWVDLEAVDPGLRDRPDGIHVIDGSYVMDVGELQINITNHGLIGSQYSMVSTYSDAPSAQWPAGSGVEYLWGAGLWVGAMVQGKPLVSTGQYEREFRPLGNLEDTIYESIDGTIVRPTRQAGRTGARVPDPAWDDDGDGLYDEDIPNGYDDDGDGLIDEDFGQIGKQMMTCTMYDNTRLSQEDYPDHEPMGLKVVQKSYAWDSDEYDDFVIFDFEIQNVGRYILDDVYVGLFTDCDIGARDSGETSQDDIAGTYSTVMRSSDGTFFPVSFAWMKDDAEHGAVPGYFAVTFFGEGYRTGPFYEGPYSPARDIKGYQRFSGQTPYELGGDPTNDAERYELMSRREFDPDVPEGMRNDYRFLVSSGPWRQLRPGQKVDFRLAMVMGLDLQEVAKRIAEIKRIFLGAYFDLDGDPTTGVGGRESRWCYVNYPPKNDIVWFSDADMMDTGCLGGGVVLTLIKKSDFVRDPETHLLCIWVNTDNCLECDRRAGRECTHGNDYFIKYWDCDQEQLSPETRIGCTGVGGRESEVRWIADATPPSPGLRVVPGDDEVRVYWDDASEVEQVAMLDFYGFESYRIWRADKWSRPPGTSEETGPPSEQWQLLAEYDVENYYRVARTDFEPMAYDTIAMGDNTGLDVITYRPRCLDDTRYAGLGEAMQAVVDADTAGAYRFRPPLRDGDGLPIPELAGLLPWESEPAVLDTFFAATGREADPAAGVPAKHATRYYEYADRHVANGRIYFYAVSTTTHRLERRPEGYVPAAHGIESNLRTSFSPAVPGTEAQTAAERAREGANIFVYPNPATVKSLAEFQPLHPNADDPTGLRVMFANLPQARNTIEIFTLDGDLVASIEHDGTGGRGEKSWNLVSRNGQQVASGMYLYTVHSDDSRFADFIGKFVVIR